MGLDNDNSDRSDGCSGSDWLREFCSVTDFSELKYSNQTFRPPSYIHFPHSFPAPAAMPISKTNGSSIPGQQQPASQQPQETKPRRSSITQIREKHLKPFNTSEIKILLLENINQTAVEAFQKQGYQVCLLVGGWVGGESHGRRFRRNNWS